MFTVQVLLMNLRMKWDFLFPVSPLWEMVQEGVDLKSIKWTQHWMLLCWTNLSVQLRQADEPRIFRPYSLKHAQYYFSVLENWTRLPGDDFKNAFGWTAGLAEMLISSIPSFQSLNICFSPFYSTQFLSNIISYEFLLATFFIVCVYTAKQFRNPSLAVVPVLRPAESDKNSTEPNVFAL